MSRLFPGEDGSIWVLPGMVGAGMDGHFFGLSCSGSKNMVHELIKQSLVVCRDVIWASM